MIEFDIYTCDGLHVLVVERKAEWGEAVMTEVGCKFDNQVADYRTTCKLEDLQAAVMKYVDEMNEAKPMGSVQKD